MYLKRPAFTIGIEEEYLLVDRNTRDLVSEPPGNIVARCSRLLKGQVSPEFLKSQIEVETKVSKTVREAGEDLRHLRQTVAKVAAEDNLAPIASSTHPFAKCTSQEHTERECPYARLPPVRLCKPAEPDHLRRVRLHWIHDRAAR